MKKQLLKPTFVLATAAAAATLFTGCASMRTGGYSGVEEPVNTLAYTAPTDHIQLSKWTGSRFLFLPMQSQDLYYFQVPDTGYEPGSSTVFGEGRADADYSGRADMSSGQMRVGDVDHREIGMGAPSAFEYGTGSSKVIRHQPGAAR